MQVLVVEKGTYTPAAQLTTLEKDAYDNLYEKGGLMMTSEDGGESVDPGDISPALPKRSSSSLP